MERRRCPWDVVRRAGAGISVLVATVGLSPVAVASAAANSVGVVDFYAPAPLPVVDTVIPERAAADELSMLLTRAGAVTVVPRAEIAKAEAAMRWRAPDALSFARLAELAHAVGAGRLVVGWIPLFDLGGPGFVPFPNDGSGMPVAQAMVVVQVFDAAQGRIVAETTRSASAIGVMPGILARDVLRNALAPTIPWLVTQLAPASMRNAPGARLFRACCQ